MPMKPSGAPSSKRKKSVAPGASPSSRAAKRSEAPSAASAERRASTVPPPVLDILPPPRPSRRAGGDAKLRFRLARVLRVSDNLVARAVRAYDRLFELEPEDQVEILIEMAQESARAGDPREALRALRKALEIKPQAAELYTEIGLVQLSQDASEAAVQAFDRAKTLGDESYRRYRFHAEALIQVGRDEEAVSELEGAVRVCPTIPDPLYRMGVVLDKLGLSEAAIDALELAVEMAPGEIGYHQSLGFALESAGRRSEAVECFKRALELERMSAE